jgi:UrcA family protein
MFSTIYSFRRCVSALALAASALTAMSMTARADAVQQIDIAGGSPLVVTSAISILPINVKHVTVLDGSFSVVDHAKLDSRVKISDLNLSTYAGVMELKWRVTNAAQEVCKELANRYPNGTPSETECAESAAKNAMATVRKVLAAIEKRAPIDRFASTN